MLPRNTNFQDPDFEKQSKSNSPIKENFISDFDIKMLYYHLQNNKGIVNPPDELINYDYGDNYDFFNSYNTEIADNSCDYSDDMDENPSIPIVNKSKAPSKYPPPKIKIDNADDYDDSMDEKILVPVSVKKSSVNAKHAKPRKLILKISLTDIYPENESEEKIRKKLKNFIDNDAPYNLNIFILNTYESRTTENFIVKKTASTWIYRPKMIRLSIDESTTIVKKLFFLKKIFDKYGIIIKCVIIDDQKFFTYPVEDIIRIAGLASDIFRLILVRNDVTPQ